MNKLSISLTIIMLLSVTVLWAQPGSTPATPIDGGLSLLLAAGGIYGLKKLKDSRKN